jgi:type III pantothenate kinase
MLLTIDSGNTNVVFAVFDGEQPPDGPRGRWRASSDAKRTADEYAVWLTQLMALEGLGPADINGAIIASVVPRTVYAMKTLCSRYFKVEPMMIGEPGVELGIAVNAQQVGADRLVNAVAGHAKYEGALIILDFGTATSFDVVGPEGSYEGGVLAPGVDLSVEALYQASAQLPRIAVRRPDKVVGKATVPAMQSGLYWGYASMIEGVIERIKAETGWSMTVIATGGLAPLFAEACPSIDHSDPDLTVRGLALIYKANRKDRP